MSYQIPVANTYFYMCVDTIEKDGEIVGHRGILVSRQIDSNMFACVADNRNSVGSIKSGGDIVKGNNQ